MRNIKNTHRMGGKLDIQWTGPYEVVEDCGKMLYKLKSRKAGNVLKTTVHCSRLKYYTHPAGEEQDDEKEEDMEEREAEENEQEESDKEEQLGENKGELDEGNKKKVCDSYSSISILDVCDITCILPYSGQFSLGANFRGQTCFRENINRDKMNQGGIDDVIM